MKKQKEFELQKQVCGYIRVAYPEVLFLGQAKTMSDLIAKGYQCYFCWDFDTAKRIIDNYLNLGKEK